MKPMNSKRVNNESKSAIRSAQNSIVDSLAFYAKLKLAFTFLLGSMAIVFGFYVMGRPGVDVSIVKASVVSVKWDGKDYCGVKRRVKKSKVYPCDVVLQYNEGDSKKKYEFSGEHDVRYKIGDDVDLYRLDDGTIDHNDPNAWKELGKLAIFIGSLMVIGSLIGFFICSRNQLLCFGYSY